MESQLQAAIQPKSHAAKTEQHGDPGLKFAPVAVHQPSTGYSDAGEKQRFGTASPGCYYPPRNVDQEPLRTLLQSMYKQEVSKIGHPDTHTTEYVLDPTAKSFEPVSTRKEHPPLLPQASLTCGIQQPNIVHSMAKLLQAKYMQLLYRVYQLFPILLDKMWILQLIKTVLIDDWSNSGKEAGWQDEPVSSYYAN